MTSLKQRVEGLERRVNELEYRAGILNIFESQGYWEGRPLVRPLSGDPLPEPKWDIRGMIGFSGESREQIIARYLDPVRDYGMIEGRKGETHDQMLKRLYPKGNYMLISFVGPDGEDELLLAKYGATIDP